MHNIVKNVSNINRMCIRRKLGNTCFIGNINLFLDFTVDSACVWNVNFDAPLLNYGLHTHEHGKLFLPQFAVLFKPCPSPILNRKPFLYSQVFNLFRRNTCIKVAQACQKDFRRIYDTFAYIGEILHVY